MIQINQTFDFKGYQIAYHQSGTGAPMIMLHNGGCSHYIWKNQIEHFSKTHTVIAFDLLGFGESDRPRIHFTLPLYVDMLNQFINDNDIQQPILMGNCIGAAISLEFSTTYPGKANSLILCNICGGASMMKYFHPYMFYGKEKTFSVGLYKTMFSISKLDYVKEKIIERLYGTDPENKDDIFKRLFNGLKHPMQPQSRIMLIKGLPSFSKFDRYEDDVSQIPPTMIFWGKNNRVLPIERGQLLIDHIKPMTCKIYPEEGHLLMAENPNQFNQDVELFLKKVG